jgi:hypothetical protein
MASRTRGALYETASLMASDPAGIVTEAFPRNFKGRSEAGSISAFMVRRAAWARPITRGCSPKVLDIRILNLLPPALTCTIKRTDWFRKVSAVAGSAACAAVDQVPIQWTPALKAVFDASTARTGASARKRFVIDRSP